MEQTDLYRRWLGTMLEARGLGPIETPSRVVLTGRAVTLKGYADARDGGPALLLVPAPIKRAYIWDLLPEASVVRRCLCARVRPYLLQWERPGVAEQEFGLAEYADRLILDCLQAVEAETGEGRAFLAGHSLGGTLAAIFASLYPERVRGLILLGAPLHFGPSVGAFGPIAAVAPPASLLTAMLGNVPGSLLSLASLLAAPATFEWARWLDWLRSLPDAEARQRHLAVERWALDESPLARRLFDEVVELLYREDRLMRGTLLIRGRRAAPESVVAPLLTVADARCRIVPPESVLPYHQAVSSPERLLLWYAGDTGVALQHVGMLVGRTAHRDLWPQVLRWIEAHS